MDTAFFILSKLIGLALQVETWLAIGMVVSLVAGRFVHQHLARWSESITLVALVVVGIFPIGEVLLRPLETKFPLRAAPAQIDGIIVLGGVEDQRATAAWGEPQLNDAAKRLTAAAALAVELKNVLYQINADDDIVTHGCSLSFWWWLYNHHGTLRCRSWRGHPTHQFRLSAE